MIPAGDMKPDPCILSFFIFQLFNTKSFCISRGLGITTPLSQELLVSYLSLKYFLDSSIEYSPLATIIVISRISNFFLSVLVETGLGSLTGGCYVRLKYRRCLHNLGRVYVGAQGATPGGHFLLRLKSCWFTSSKNVFFPPWLEGSASMLVCGRHCCRRRTPRTK